jgi:hypothetical protein
MDMSIQRLHDVEAQTQHLKSLVLSTKGTHPTLHLVTIWFGISYLQLTSKVLFLCDGLFILEAGPASNLSPFYVKVAQERGHIRLIPISVSPPQCVL